MNEYLKENMSHILDDDALTNILCEKDSKGNYSIRRGVLSRVSSVFALGRIKNLESQVKSAKDTDKKMDLLAKQNFYVGLLISISINSKLKRNKVR